MAFLYGRESAARNGTNGETIWGGAIARTNAHAAMITAARQEAAARDEAEATGFRVVRDDGVRSALRPPQSFPKTVMRPPAGDKGLKKERSL